MPSSSPEVTVAPPSATASATDTPIPTRTPKPTKTPKPELANLVVDGLKLDVRTAVINEPFNATFTIRNTGKADAGPFQAAVTGINRDGPTYTSDPFDVSGLAAGSSKDVTISVTLPSEQFWRLSATADVNDAVTESNENDNADPGKDFQARSGLPDLEWDDLTATYDQTTADGYLVDLVFKVSNSGTRRYDHFFDPTVSIGLDWKRASDDATGTGNSCVLGGDVEIGAQIAPSCAMLLPAVPGTYVITGTIDPTMDLDELSRNNNTRTVQLTVPST